VCLVVHHRVTDREKFMATRKTSPETHRPGVQLRHFLPARDASAADCLWEAESLDALSRLPRSGYPRLLRKRLLRGCVGTGDGPPGARFSRRLVEARWSSPAAGRSTSSRSEAPLLPATKTSVCTAFLTKADVFSAAAPA
jgi:hypothetical protein